ECSASVRPTVPRLALPGLALAVLLAGCASMPGSGPQDQQADPQAVEKLQERVAGLQKAMGQQGKELSSLQAQMKQAKGTLGDFDDLAKRVGSLRDRIHRLGGSTKVNGHELDRLSQQLDHQIMQIRADLKRIDDRLTRLEEGTDGLDSGSSRGSGKAKGGKGKAAKEEQQPEAQKRPADERAYRKAFHALRLGKYERSITGFRKFLGKYPDSSYADNAQYWMGEAFYVRGRYERALEAFKKVPRQYSDSDKVPAALLKAGYAYYELEDYRNARKVLLKVAQNYPDQRVGKLARKRLERIRKEQF
ncbi:MAG TPA: tol-pal system protein YbgF, partial [Gammaproteobacteria bacterium]|nr:tol-pal system protein YbgF [Gammaproteobacteria bacterium]